MNKECILFERSCIDCGECSICDLDRNKKCNNCEKCLEQVEDYITVNLEEFIIVQEENEKYTKRKGK